MTATVPDSEAGIRLDVYAAALLGVSRAGAQKYIENGAVRVNGLPAPKNRRLESGDVIEAVLPDPEPIEAQPQDIPLDVLYEDGELLVVNKPQGMVVHPAPGNPDGTLVNALLAHCGDSLSSINGKLRPGIVHRIDKDTSGLLIVAKTDRAHRGLAEQIASHSFGRRYDAVLVGTPREERGTVDAPVGRHPTDRKRMAVVAGGREAVTHWEVIARYPGYTHVRCRLETGRTHQIRVHMAYIGHPILGDTVYGAKKEVPGLTGQCLHAVGLRFLHPRTHEVVELFCPLPEEFTRMLQKIRR